MEIYNIADKNVTASSSTKSKNSAVDTEMFLKLLTTELCNQDPTNPTDGTEYISQLAQFTSLQQMQEINERVSSLLASKDFTSGTEMIGKEVMIQLDESTAISDVVKGIRLSDGNVYVVTDSGYYSIKDIIGV